MFCEHCGKKFPVGAAFCPSCGEEKRKDMSALPAPAMPAPGRPATPRKLRKERIMIPVAVILILIGVGSMGLAVIGKTTAAQVTGCEQVLFINNDDSTRNPSRYKLEYTFFVGEEQYTGSVTRVFPAGSHMRQTIRVRYLPFWPYINAEDGEWTGLAGPIITGAGILMLVFAAKKRFRPRSKNR